MNLKEALNLLTEIDMECSLDKTKKGIFTSIEQVSPNGEIALLLSSEIVSDTSLSCIKAIIEKYGLKLGKVKTETGEKFRIYE